MLIRKIIELPVIKTLGKDCIWRMIDEIVIEPYESSDSFNLENNTQIKINIVIDEWDEDDHIEVYTILFEDKVIGVGGSLGDEEDTYKYDVYFIDEQGYIDMITYLYRLKIKKELDVIVQSLDFDFKL